MGLDDFFLRALAAGAGIALMTGPLGCFILWRRMAYFGDTLAHAALPGITLALWLQIAVPFGVLLVSALIALALLFLQARRLLPADSLLGILSHAALALGLLGLAFMRPQQMDVMGFLFGDILAVSRLDILLIYGGAVVILALLAWIWRPLFAACVSEEMAAAENLHPRRAGFIFTLLLALAIALAMQLTGILLVSALLIIPAAAARVFAAGPEQMALLAMPAGIIAIFAGLFFSLSWDAPAGPAIIAAALGLFLCALFFSFLFSFGGRA